MTASYILIFVLLFHIILFRKMIFKWNIFGIFFIATCIFSIIGILMFPFMRMYAGRTFWTFKLELITNQDVFRTQMLAVGGLLLVLYSYVFGLVLMYRRVECINHFRIKNPIKNNLSKVNFYFMLLCIFLFLLVYLIIKRNVLISGLFDGLIGRQPVALLESRRGITSNYLYVVITYNLLPFLTMVSLYLMMKKKTLSARMLFIGLFTVSFILILLLFQKRPLILFLLSLFLSAFVFKKYITIKKKRVRTPQEKRKLRRRAILIGLSLFSLLLLLYYSATTYRFNSVFEGVSTLTEVVLTRVFGRLSIPAFCYVHYFPSVEDHYTITNIGMFSKIFNYELYPDSKVLFNYFSRNEKEGSLAINSIIDFYGAFGYYGFFIGNIILGFFISGLDAFLNRLEKNNINIIFIIFCFIFAYYLSQASLARSLLGYGFFFFVITWVFLQKNFRIKLRP
ncbi:oligosaccharide repeat unit polymerase [Kordia periserrulae]|uniref:Oligosaccharide repeat unit polymerase n=1 Tax=Kordia periserrulae TaxID=701523 RepID=A0A2T6BWJ0_9FLAO|nr:oligosaccharide repeat unit polymerase [Kordia periserrulae]PTX60429.1 oligosaccharide repeat unit polymerase [Kordia periserrulae]